MSKKILVVGQGLAGTLLAFAILERGALIKVINASHKKTASEISAGVYNPIVLKRFTPVWEGLEQVEILEREVRKIQSILKANLLIKHPVHRVFHSKDEVTTWEKKREILNKYLGDIQPVHGILNPYLTGVVPNSGRVDVAKMLLKFRDYAIQNGLYESELFDFNELKVQNDMIFYKGNLFDAVVFCEGVEVTANPYFNFLPIRKNKGERLVVQIDAFDIDYTLKKRHFLFKQSEGTYYVGGTYSPVDISEMVTVEKKAELVQGLKELTQNNYKIIEHDWAFRPVSKDRRPILGQHPVHRKLWVFNGLGTRGTLTGAKYAQVLADAIIHSFPIPEEVNIKRFV